MSSITFSAGDFAEAPTEPIINGVASTYREALREAQSMGLTTTVPETLYLSRVKPLSRRGVGAAQ